jgi:hypothetical protein
LTSSVRGECGHRPAGRPRSTAPDIHDVHVETCLPRVATWMYILRRVREGTRNMGGMHRREGTTDDRSRSTGIGPSSLHKWLRKLGQSRTCGRRLSVSRLVQPQLQTSRGRGAPLSALRIRGGEVQTRHPGAVTSRTHEGDKFMLTTRVWLADVTVLSVARQLAVLAASDNRLQLTRYCTTRAVPCSRNQSPPVHAFPNAPRAVPREFAVAPI